MAIVSSKELWFFSSEVGVQTKPAEPYREETKKSRPEQPGRSGDCWLQKTAGYTQTLPLIQSRMPHDCRQKFDDRYNLYFAPRKHFQLVKDWQRRRPFPVRTRLAHESHSQTKESANKQNIASGGKEAAMQSLKFPNKRALGEEKKLRLETAHNSVSWPWLFFLGVCE